jgi:hypothetical protein
MTSRLTTLLTRCGHDARSACEGAGLTLEEVTNEGARVAYAACDRLLEATAAALGADGLALALSAVVDERTYDAAGLVLFTSRTLREGLERAFAYQRLWGDGARFTLRDSARGGAIGFAHPGPSELARAVFAELAFVETMGAV